MANIILVEGLLASIKKGETLRDAMISFYNAGYEKREIEKAARDVQKIMQGQQITPEIPYTAQKKSENTENKPLEKQIQKPDFKPFPGQSIQRASAYGDNAESIKKIKAGISSAINQLNRIEFPNGNSQSQQTFSTPAPAQTVSGYGEKPEKRTGAIIAIIVTLIILIGLLAGVFVFKDSILSFFDKSGFFSRIFG